MNYLTGLATGGSRRIESAKETRTLELDRRFVDTLHAWEAGADAADTIATLRLLIGDGLPATSRHLLGRVLQAEGREEEAATEFWRASYVKLRNGTVSSPHEGNVGILVRAADCLEDVGRTEEAAWLFDQTDQKDRRQAYLHATFSAKPAWARKWMRKLLRENPKDAEVQHYLARAESNLAYQAKNEPETIPRDVSHE